MDELVRHILEIPEETQTLEFKRLEGVKVVSKVVETIVALANTDGGTIVFGIDDPEKTKLKGLERVYGIEENKDLFDEIGREVQKISPPIGNLWIPEVFELKDIKKNIALLRIGKAVSGFHTYNNQVYVRQLKSNKKLTPSEVIKFSYAKGFEKADRELVDVDFELLKTPIFETWSQARSLPATSIEKILFDVGLARKNSGGILQPTRAAVLLFAKHPTHLMETKCAIRVFQYAGTIETFQNVPNLVGVPETIDGPLIFQIKKAHEYVLSLLRSGIEIRSGFLTKYQIPERAVKEAITNAVIHRDYHIKRDIEVSIYEDRMEIFSPGLFPYNITKTNIGHVRADGYRNDLLVKHLREFPEQPNLDRNEGVQAMRNEMKAQNLYEPIFITYPTYEDSVRVVLLNEKRASEWEKVKSHLEKNKYVNNEDARKVTGVVQLHKMSRLLRKWVSQGLLLKIMSENGAPKYVKYKLSNAEELRTQN